MISLLYRPSVSCPPPISLQSSLQFPPCSCCPTPTPLSIIIKLRDLYRNFKGHETKTPLYNQNQSFCRLNPPKQGMRQHETPLPPCNPQPLGIPSKQVQEGLRLEDLPGLLPGGTLPLLLSDPLPLPTPTPKRPPSMDLSKTLPPPGDALHSYAPRSLKNGTYHTTGLFPVGSKTHTRKDCHSTQTLLIDADLKDLILHKNPGMTSREVSKALRDSEDEDLQESLRELYSLLLENLEEPPSVTVCTGYGFHAYFHLSSPTQDLAQAREANRRLIERVNLSAGFPLADVKVNNPGDRILRTPGTLNTKNPKKPRPCEVVHSDLSIRYPLSVFLPSSPSLATSSPATRPPQDLDFSEVTAHPPHAPATLRDLSETIPPGGKLRLQCPFHEGTPTDSAFLRLDSFGRPFLHCSSESRNYRDSAWKPPASAPDVWGSLAMRGKPPRPSATFANALRILQGDPTLRGRIYYHLRHFKPYISPLLIPPDTFQSSDPWETVKERDREFTDLDLISLKAFCSEAYSVEFTTSVLFEVIQYATVLHRRNPVLEYLQDCAELPTVRDRDLSEWLYLALPRLPVCALHTAYSRKILLSAVSRVCNPGSRVDTVPLLVGPQGVKKSTLWATLAGEHFADSHLDISNKDSYTQLASAWIYEIAELFSFSKKEGEAVKAWISSRFDTFRAPYGKFTETRPRHTLIVATTNDQTPLKDPTGSRRFWPIAAEEIDIEYIQENREKLWGAAFQAYNKGESHWLTSDEEVSRAIAADTYTPESAYTDTITLIIERGKVPPLFSISSLLERLALPLKEQRRYLPEVSQVLKGLGAARVAQYREDGKKRRHWVAPGIPLPPGREYASLAGETRHKKTLPSKIAGKINANRGTK